MMPGDAVRCFLGAIAQQHCVEHPSTEQLLSSKSMAQAQVRAMAMLAMDTIADIERQHATGRREASMREQTHLGVQGGSALQILGQLRAENSELTSHIAQDLPHALRARVRSADSPPAPHGAS
jgi:hypothetical protein